MCSRGQVAALWSDFLAEKEQGMNPVMKQLAKEFRGFVPVEERVMSDEEVAAYLRAVRQRVDG